MQLDRLLIPFSIDISEAEKETEDGERVSTKVHVMGKGTVMIQEMCEKKTEKFSC